ncbi:MAG: hypothetical protein JSS81_05180 [Acidobacteria bacterium]|nr:hypothetical protein [Acidobacteriota bacterium]
MNFRTFKNTAAVWLFALLLNAFSFAVSAETPKAAADEMVFCPLTKKLQPVKATGLKTRRDPFAEICAGEQDQKAFWNELSGAGNALKSAALSEKQFEALVFDFLQKGKAAFANLPPAPGSPEKNAVRTSTAFAAPGNQRETPFVRETAADNFSFAQRPRPPDAVSAVLFEAPLFPKSNIVSRRLAPRAPPFSI